ncbi:hypothetical protein [Allorhodopirellula solitaria]|uniref:hypothetical protein n=1 Tax=Allorhodopirellula solitaria TaxID=2527987 RepID=UPI001644561A|nr:hypothetical protein [Allorhodopirellula solitaria]
MRSSRRQLRTSHHIRAHHPIDQQRGTSKEGQAQYLELLEWTGRQIRSDKVGAIPEHLRPILTRIGLDTHGWCDIVLKFGRVFRRAAGSPEHLAEEASRRGQNWLCAPGNPLGLSAV